MSNTYYETNKVSLTAFIGGETKQTVQLTLGSKETEQGYVELSDKEALELAMNLLLRVGFCVTATGNEEGISLSSRD